MASHSPPLLTEAQRAQLSRLPDDLSDRDIARYYTLSADDLAFILPHRRHVNQLGIAVQLCLLRFPGRTLMSMPDVPVRVLRAIAQQLGVAPTAFVRYGARRATCYEHLDAIKAHYGYRTLTWQDTRAVMGAIFAQAQANAQALPLVKAVLQQLRDRHLIAPGITVVERLVWGVQRVATRSVERLLTRALTPAHQVRLDALLVVPIEARGTRRGAIPLTWLRAVCGDPSANQLLELLQRLAALDALNLPPLPAALHRSRWRQLARQGALYRPQPLRELAPRFRYALLLAHLADLRQEHIDVTLTMFDQVFVELLRRLKAAHGAALASTAQTVHAQLGVLVAAGAAFLHATEAGLDPVTTVFGVVPEATLRATVTAATSLARPTQGDPLDLLVEPFKKQRRAFLAVPRIIALEPVQHRTPALKAFDHIAAIATHRQRVTAVSQRIGAQTYSAPLGHLTDRWRHHALQGNTINAYYYEAATCEALRGDLRAGTVAVAASRRYRAFGHYLLPRTQWQTLKDTGQTELALDGDAHAYLAQQEQAIHDALRALQRDLDQIPGLSVDRQGQLHLSRLEPAVPAAAVQMSRRIYGRVPRIDLPDLLGEVLRGTGFLHPFTHLRDGTPLDGDAGLPLLAAIMGSGLNLGLTTLAGASPFSYRELSWAMDWFVREETLRAGLVILDNAVLRHPFSRAWSTGTHSSSDGLRIQLGVQAANADYNSAYLHHTRGVSLYLHVADAGPAYHQEVIGINDSEAYYVIDALCHHETDLEIETHTTDTGGVSEHVFALCALLGFRFIPRMKGVLNRNLVTLGPKHDYGALNQLIGGRLTRGVIIAHWDEARHIAASIKHGAAAATTLMRRLAATPRKAGVARALTGIGQIERTRFTLAYLRDETLQRQAQVGLNRGEAVNSLARALLFGRRGMFRDRALIDQTHRASCLLILIAAIAVWNTTYLADAVAALRAEGEDIPDALLQHLSPLGWGHINLLGRYQFRQTSPWDLQQRRPLRAETEDDGDLDDTR
jgi:TnpA family transposase